MCTLADIPEVASVSGATDLHIDVSARDAHDLYRFAGLNPAVPGVERTTVSVAMLRRSPTGHGHGCSDWPSEAANPF